MVSAGLDRGGNHPGHACDRPAHRDSTQNVAPLLAHVITGRLAWVRDGHDGGVGDGRHVVVRPTHARTRLSTRPDKRDAAARDPAKRIATGGRQSCEPSCRNGAGGAAVCAALLVRLRRACGRARLRAVGRPAGRGQEGGQDRPLHRQFPRHRAGGREALFRALPRHPDRDRARADRPADHAHQDRGGGQPDDRRRHRHFRPGAGARRWSSCSRPMRRRTPPTIPRWRARPTACGRAPATPGPSPTIPRW